MAKRQPDGTVSLAQANAYALKVDEGLRSEAAGAARAAHQAIDSAFESPLSRGRRMQKPLRAIPSNVEIK